jgi:hypothetical protein
MQRNKETVQHEQGTTEECRGSWLTVEGLSHLPEKQINQLIEEEPEITIKGYLLFLREISDIEKSTENE